jgi:hypothetical protein
MSTSNDELRRAVREMAQEVGRVAEQAGRLVGQAARDAGAGRRAWGPPRRAASPGSGPSPLALIRELGELRDAGLLTEEEFQAKKAELLSRV